MGYLFHRNGTPFKIVNSEDDVIELVDHWSRKMNIPLSTCELSPCLHFHPCLASFTNCQDSPTGHIEIGYFFAYHKRQYLDYVVAHEVAHALQWFRMVEEYGLEQALLERSKVQDFHGEDFDDIIQTYQPDFSQSVVDAMYVDYKRYTGLLHSQARRAGRLSSVAD